MQQLLEKLATREPVKLSELEKARGSEEFAKLRAALDGSDK